MQMNKGLNIAEKETDVTQVRVRKIRAMMQGQNVWFGERTRLLF